MNLNQYNKISFTSIAPVPASIPTQECELTEEHILNTTTFLRDDLDWTRTSDFLAKTMPSGTKIFNFACSDGSEVYSTKLMVDKRLKERNSDKKFEYQAFDINKNVINKANTHKIRLTDKDEYVYKRDISSDFDEKFKKIGDEAYEVIDKGLVEDISFEYGDITKWAKAKKEEPCVVMFRNAWCYLTINQQEQLFDNLERNLPKGSVLIVGADDIQESKCLIGKLMRSDFKHAKETSRFAYGGKFVYTKV